MDFATTLKYLSMREESVAGLQRLKDQIFSTVASVDDVFPKNFVIDRPADISGAGGDFAFAIKQGDYSLLVVADSLGHSLQGAAGSLALYCLLMDAIGLGISWPGEIIDHVHRGASNFLKNHVTCDIGIARYNDHTRELDYAGAKRTANHFNGENVVMVPASRLSIGQERGERHTVNTHTIVMHPRNRVYLSTDGLETQPGGLGQKTLQTKGLRKWLSDTQAFALEDQKYVISQLVDAWIGEGLQTDDFILVGIEF